MITPEQFLQEFGPLIEQLRRTQQALGLSDRQMVARYRQLGSAKTWRQRLLQGNVAEMNLTRMAQRLRELKVILSGGTPVENYIDLPFSRAMDLKLIRLEGQTTDRRILVCLAPTGVGKSAWARHAVAQDRAQRVYVRMRPSYREKKVHICAAIARALGEAPSTSGEADAEAKVIEQLSAMPRTVVIDEAHEGGVALMKLLRTFVDETPAKFVYLAYPTEYERVKSATSGALIEAQQFLGRCLKPIFDDYAYGTRLEDVTHILQSELGLNSEAREIAKQLMPVLRRKYNLRLLADAIEEARAMASGDKPGARDVITAAYGLSGTPLPEQLQTQKGEE